MTIKEMRVKLAVFCHDIGNLEDPCANCPVNNIDNVCEDFNWQNAPERLVEKAYQAMKEEKTMNITADDIRKAALKLIWKRTQSSATAPATATTVESYTYGYILGVCELAKRVTEGEEDD